MKSTVYLLLVTLIAITSCKKEPIEIEDTLYPAEERMIGKTIAAAINIRLTEDSTLLPIQHPDAYNYLDSALDKVISSSAVPLSEDFKWKAIILHDDSKTTYFVAPGGYIFLYSGLLKTLYTEAQLMYILNKGVGLIHTGYVTRRLVDKFGITKLKTVRNDFPFASTLPAILLERYSLVEMNQTEYFTYLNLCPSEYATLWTYDSFWILDASEDLDLFDTYTEARREVWSDAQNNGECQGDQENRTEYLNFKNLLP